MLTRRGSGGLFELLALDRARILTLGRNIAIDELDDRDRRGVGRANAGLNDAGVAAVAIGVAGGEYVEQLLELGLVQQPRLGEPAIGEPALLGERHQLLDIGPQLLGL